MNVSRHVSPRAVWRHFVVAGKDGALRTWSAITKTSTYAFWLWWERKLSHVACRPCLEPTKLSTSMNSEEPLIVFTHNVGSGRWRDRIIRYPLKIKQKVLRSILLSISSCRPIWVTLQRYFWPLTHARMPRYRFLAVNRTAVWCANFPRHERPLRKRPFVAQLALTQMSQSASAYGKTSREGTVLREV